LTRTKKGIFQYDVLEVIQVSLEITYGIASCSIISRRLLRTKVCDIKSSHVLKGLYI